MCGFCGKLDRNSLCNKCKIQIQKNTLLKIEDYKNTSSFFDEHIYLFRYSGEIRNIILNYKFKEKSYIYNTFVEIIKNNYDMTWEKENPYREDGFDYGTGVFNGEIGTITAIDEKEKSVIIKFDDEKVAVYEYTDLEQIEHSYAITIHKAQGSEFDVVIMCVPRTAPVLLTRNLLYTGITRAKDLLIIVGDKNVTEFMINNVDSKKRNTGLKYKLKMRKES